MMSSLRPRPVRLDRPTLAALRATTVTGLLSIAFLITGHELERHNPHLDGYRIAAYGCAGALAVCGVLTARFAAKDLAMIIGGHARDRASAPLRVLVLIIGYLITALAVLDVLHVDLSQFLVGGAVTGIVLGIAAQQALGNFFAGLVLLITRPYTVGDRVTIFSGSINGPHEGTVADVGLIYTSARTEAGLLKIPNGVLLASAVRHPAS